MIAAKTRRAGGREGKDARHSLRKVAQGRCMTDEQRAFEVGEVLHALVFQLSVADVSFLQAATQLRPSRVASAAVAVLGA